MFRAGEDLVIDAYLSNLPVFGLDGQSKGAILSIADSKRDASGEKGSTKVTYFASKSDLTE
jgi:hypothetical protein